MDTITYTSPRRKMSIASASGKEGSHGFMSSHDLPTPNEDNLASIDPLAFVIQECTFISSSMRKNNRSTSNPFASILLNQFLTDSSYPDDSILQASGSSGNLNNFPKVPKSSSASSKNNAARFKDDDPFLSGFVELRSILSETDDISLIDIITLLQPFLVVIKSPSTSCYITSITISSLTKFFKYNIINENQSNIVQALSQIVSTLSHCRFEGADQTQDDILLVKIIQLLEAIVISKLGSLLTDDSMYEIISTCFSLAINTRRRDMLRSAAENSLLTITQVVFSKLKNLESIPEIDHNTKSSNVEFSNDLLPNDTIGRSTPVVESNDDLLQEKSNERDEEDTLVHNEQKEEEKSPTEGNVHEESNTSKGKESLELVNQEADLSPYGIPCMSEFLNHTIDIISPENKYRFTESTRALALEILIRIIEVSGAHLAKHSQLFSLISDNCCHHLVLLITSSDSMILISSAMKLILYFSLNFPNLLKAQLELVFKSIFESILANDEVLHTSLQDYRDSVFEMSKKGKFETNSLTESEIEDLRKEFDTGKSPEIKEFFIESLSVLWCRSPYLFINLFKSYESDFERSDITDRFLQILCRLSYSDCSIVTTNSVPPICLDGLLSFVNNIYNRVKRGIAEKIDPEAAEKVSILQSYTQKSDFIDCIRIWNEKPSKGFEALHEKGFIQDPSDDKEVASFLFTNSGRVDKRKLGELLAKPTNSKLLKEFVNLLDFKNLRPDESLRILLSYFRLPGEAQQIERIVTIFSERYIECQDYTEEADEEDTEKVLPDVDSMIVLSFSIIMLNTDLYNPSVKKPMTLDDYQRNVRGTYNGTDFPSWYTEKIYYSIKEKEIIMPEEHKGSQKYFENAWHSVVAEQESKKMTDHDSVTTSWITDNGSSLSELLAFDKILFGKHCKNLISAFVIMFDDATHDSLITKMMSTIEKCAAIAIFFGMEDIVDSVIEITAHLSTLTGVKKSEYSYEVRDVLPIIELNNDKENEPSIYVSDASILFGRDYRAQLSLIVLFRILKRFNYKVTKGWYYLTKAILKLFEIGMFDPNVFKDFQKKLQFDQLAKPPAEFRLNESDVNKDGGLFSTFSSFMKGITTETPEPTREEIEITISCLEFIDTIGVKDVFFQVSKIKDNENMNKLTQILLALLPHKSDSTERFFAEESLLLLELCVCYLIITKNNKLINQVFSKCDSIISDTNEMKMSTICRILSYKLLLLNVCQKNENNKSVLKSTVEYIFALSKNSRDSFVKHGISVLIPLEQLALTKESWCSKEVLFSDTYWNIIRIIASLPKNTESVYIFIFTVVKQHTQIIEYRNFMNILGLLDEISAVGAYGAQWEHEYDKLIDSGVNVIDKKNPFQHLVDIGIKSITLTSDLGKVIKTESFQKSVEERKETNQNIVVSWYPLIEAISHQCYNPCRQIRNHALNVLGQLLLKSSTIPLEELSIDKIFEAACLRLLVELMKPEVNGTDVKGMTKTQRDVIGLSGKVIITHTFKDLENAVEKLFAVSSQLLQHNRNIYPHTGHEDEIVELLRNVLMVRKSELDLTKLKGYKMDGVLKKLVEEVINISNP